MIAKKLTLPLAIVGVVWLAHMAVTSMVPTAHATVALSQCSPLFPRDMRIDGRQHANAPGYEH